MLRVRTVSALAVLAALGLTPIAQADSFISTFESVSLPSTGYLNNSGAAGQFVVDGNAYNNSYEPAYDTWYGWAFSNKTNITDPTFANQYSAIAGSGSGGSSQYAVGMTFGTPAFNQVGGDPHDPAYGISNPFHPSDTIIKLAPGMMAKSIDITNTTYTYLTMKNGDPYGYVAPFSQGDYLQLDIRGYDDNDALVNTVSFFLADYTSKNPADWILVNTWSTVDLTSLAGATSLRFGLSTNVDNTDPTYGLNLPAYFAADNFTWAAVPEPGSISLMAAGLIGLAAIAARRARRSRAA